MRNYQYLRLLQKNRTRKTKNAKKSVVCRGSRESREVQERRTNKIKADVEIHKGKKNM